MTDATNDGGPAFMPAFPTYSPNPIAQGMSLRDWFAGQALNGLLASGQWSNSTHGVDEHLSMVACNFADAMLAARDAK